MNTSQTQSGCCPGVASRGPVPDLAPRQPSAPQAAPAPSVHAVKIPGGTAIIGTDRPILPVDGESPAKTRKIKPFLIDRCAVTNARFQAFVDATGYVTEAERLGDSFVFDLFLPDHMQDGPRVAAAPWWRVVPGANWRAIHGPGTEEMCDPDHPVVHVSWNDAVAFAVWAGGRLPTEAEWEHAARGGLGDVRFPWGDREPDDLSFFPCNIWQGNFPRTNTARDGHLGTAPAQSFAPNGYGLYNMVGNVWEWTQQPFKVSTLKKEFLRAHEGKKGYKLTKGGSYLCHAGYCYRYRIAARSATSPDSSIGHQGFRLVYDLAP